MIDFILLLLIIILGLKQWTLHEEIGDIQNALFFAPDKRITNADDCGYAVGAELGFYDPFCESPGWYKCRFDGIAWSKVKPLDKKGSD